MRPNIFFKEGSAPRSFLLLVPLQDAYHSAQSRAPFLQEFFYIAVCILICNKTPYTAYKDSNLAIPLLTKQVLPGEANAVELLLQASFFEMRRRSTGLQLPKEPVKHFILQHSHFPALLRLPARKCKLLAFQDTDGIYPLKSIGETAFHQSGIHL